MVLYLFLYIIIIENIILIGINMASQNLESIKLRRKALDLSQSAFAKQTGVSQSMLAKIESRKAEPSFRLATSLFEKLDELENVGSKKAKDVMNSKVITLDRKDTVEKAIHLAKKYAISQFPIVHDGFLVGSVSVRELLDARKDSKINAIAGISLPTVNENTPIEAIKVLLKSSQAVFVIMNGKVKGIITAEDLL